MVQTTDEGELIGVGDGEIDLLAGFVFDVDDDVEVVRVVGFSS